MSLDLNPILTQVAAGNQHAFRQLFTLFSQKVYGFAFKLTRSKNLAEEIVQDVFMKIWVNRNALLTINYFPSYLYTITRNHTFNILKRIACEERAKMVLKKELTETRYDTEETNVYEEYQHVLHKIINQLPPQQRLVYSLCHQQGLKYEEVAQQLNISRLTVKTHMQKALRAIKSRMLAVR